MTALENTFTEEQCRSLLGLHCFTGRDSVSFFRKKKNKALEILSENPEFVSSFAELGVTWIPSHGLCSELDRFLCKLYDSTGVY